MEHTFAAVAAMLAAVFMAVICLFALSGFFEPAEAAIPTENESFSAAQKEEKMTLGVFEGKLALFIGESPYPNMVYDFLIRTLPQEDQNLLSEGIEITSKEELESLLEDYMS